MIKEAWAIFSIVWEGCDFEQTPCVLYHTYLLFKGLFKEIVLNA